MKVSTEEFRRCFLRPVKARNMKLTCPCRKGAWTLNRPMLFPGINEDGEVDWNWKLGPTYLMVAVFCEGCGYTHLFNSAPLFRQADALDPNASFDSEAAGVM